MMKKAHAIDIMKAVAAYGADKIEDNTWYAFIVTFNKTGEDTFYVDEASLINVDNDEPADFPEAFKVFIREVTKGDV